MGHSFSEVKENEIIEGLYEKADIIREAEVSWVNSYVRFLVAKKKLYGNIVGGEFTTPTEYEIYRTFFPRWLHILSPGAFDDSSSSVSSVNEDGGGGGKDITELKALMEQLGERLEHQAPDDAQFISSRAETSDNRRLRALDEQVAILQNQVTHLTEELVETRDALQAAESRLSASESRRKQMRKLLIDQDTDSP